MPFYSAQLQINMTTGVNEDAVVNTYYFSGANAGLDVPVIELLIKNFYDDLVTIYSADVALSGHQLKIYNLDDTPPRAPLSITTYNFPATPSGASLPHEVAICMSYQATPQSGIPQARRRGRVYLGPLDTTFVMNGGYASAGLTDTVKVATETFHAAAAATSVVWSVYSPTDQDLYEIDNGWVNNDFDTQRRRGRKATLRNIWQG